METTRDAAEGSAAPTGYQAGPVYSVAIDGLPTPERNRVVWAWRVNPKAVRQGWMLLSVLNGYFTTMANHTIGHSEVTHWADVPMPPPPGD